MPMTREAARWDEAIADLFASNRDEDDGDRDEAEDEN